MSRSFIHDDFLLGNEAARLLYHGFAENEPILDFHNHLSAQQIAANHTFADLAEIWLGGDHYKWRAMRANGVPEKKITGSAPPYEKFAAWAATVPYTLGNPLYHWTHLELKRHFGFDGRLDATTAETVWRDGNARLPSLRVHDLLAWHRIELLCTTDDPADSLDTHATIARSGLKTKVYPAYRPDNALQVDRPAFFNGWIERLGQAAGMAVTTFDDLVNALKKRHDAFHAAGCRLSDHGLETCPALPATRAQVAAVFDAARAGRAATAEGRALHASFLMLEFGRWNAARGWTQQLHLGALRNANTRLLAKLGPDTGFDSIGDFPQARSLAAYLDALDRTDELPRTILYNVNPADNYVFGSMIGNYQDGTIAGKIQLGSGWWFLDQKEGMEGQMKTLANLGLLRRFVGMVTDSRSFLSFPRHEYFRRVLCNLLGEWIAKGELPDDLELIGAMVREICHANARAFFRFPAE